MCERAILPLAMIKTHALPGLPTHTPPRPPTNHTNVFRDSMLKTILRGRLGICPAT